MKADISPVVTASTIKSKSIGFNTLKYLTWVENPANPTDFGHVASVDVVLSWKILLKIYLFLSFKFRERNFSLPSISADRGWVHTASVSYANFPSLSICPILFKRNPLLGKYDNQNSTLDQIIMSKIYQPLSCPYMLISQLEIIAIIGNWLSK